MNDFIEASEATEAFVAQRVGSGSSMESVRLRGGERGAVLVVLEDFRRGKSLSVVHRDASLEKTSVSFSLSFLNVASVSHSKA